MHKLPLLRAQSPVNEKHVDGSLSAPVIPMLPVLADLVSAVLTVAHIIVALVRSFSSSDSVPQRFEVKKFSLKGTIVPPHLQELSCSAPQLVLMILLLLWRAWN